MKNPAKGLIDRHKLDKVTSWLPGVALFLCLSLFAMAALILFDAGAEPESPQSASPTAISAQGFQGLKRLLAAGGHGVEMNRFPDGPNAVHGDLEIVTFDAGNRYMPNFDFSSSASADSSATGTDSSATADSSASIDTGPGALDDEFVPSPERARHLLYNPLGRAVLVVAPKWTAAYYARHSRWAADPQLADDTTIRDMLAELSPETETPSHYDKKGDPVRPQVAPGQDVYFDDDTTIVYDKVPYVITHGQPASNLVVRRADGRVWATVGKVDDLQSISGPNLTPVLLGPKGEVILSRVNVTGGRKATKAPVYLLSDPDLLDNQILADPQKVIAAFQLIDDVSPVQNEPATRPASIVFNLTFNNLAFDHDLIHALSRPPYVGVPLSLLILGLGLMWAAFARFGPARHVAVEPPLGRGVKILADNAARLMSLTIRETKLAPAYATLMRDLVLKGRGYMQPSPSQTLDDLADRIGRMHNTTHSFADLKARAAQVATVHQLIDLTLKLHAWKTEIQRAHS